MRNMIIVAGLSLIAMLSWAQAAPDASPGQAPDEELSHHGQRGPGVAGTIAAIDNGTITLKTFDGKTAQVSTTNQTEFRKDRQAAKLADFKPGDHVFGRGELKNGTFIAAVLNAGDPQQMGMPRPGNTPDRH